MISSNVEGSGGGRCELAAATCSKLLRLVGAGQPVLALASIDQSQLKWTVKRKTQLSIADLGQDSASLRLMATRRFEHGSCGPD